MNDEQAWVSSEGFDADRIGVVDVAVHVLINERRVWSLTPREGFVRWPHALTDGINGDVELTLRDGDGHDRWGGVVTFDGSGGDDLTDRHGRSVVLNKWGQPARPYALMDGAERLRFLDELENLLADLTALGYEAFVVGGTLLGAVRDGDILGHDDDADVAWLCEETHPADVARASFAMERQLQQAGHLVVRHSAAHLQVCFGGEPGAPEFYIDIFSAFFTHGEFCEPIHMRTAALTRSDIVPTSTVTLQGREFPAPATPERWLAACYGPDWRRPDPAFRFETPQDTVRRFHGWFGSQNTHREYWNATHLTDTMPEPSEEARQLLAQLPEGARVVDAGCGLGADAMLFAEAGHETWALDFSDAAVARVRQRAGEQAVSLRAEVLNFYDRRGVIDHAVELRRTWTGPTVVFARHLLDGMTHSGRHHATQWARWVLRPGDWAVAVMNHRRSDAYDYDRPTTWHVEPDDVTATADRYGLSARLLDHTGDGVGTWIIHHAHQGGRR